MNPEIKQLFLAIVFYIWIVALFRFSGKRLAGQTTTFDLVILIALSVAIQQVTLLQGRQNAIVFFVTVFASHRVQSYLATKYPAFRELVRGRPAKLIEDGEIQTEILAEEGLVVEELEAGLRKLGIENVSEVKIAHLEETGHISAVKAP